MAEPESAMQWHRRVLEHTPSLAVHKELERWGATQRELGRQDVERALTAKGDDSPLYPRVPMFPRDEWTPAPDSEQPPNVFEQPPSLVKRVSRMGTPSAKWGLLAETLDALGAEVAKLRELAEATNTLIFAQGRLARGENR